ncbi:MAG TPA: universal stress protein [Chloroflexia bacterium]|nr:universal stress protein [Chloroflexia bacterium]
MLFKKILVAYDGSAGAERALETAIKLAHEQGTELCVISVEEQLPHYAATVGEMDEEKERTNHYFEKLLLRAAEQAAVAGVTIRPQVLAGQPAKTILKYSEDGRFDLLVMGRSGHGGTWGRFMGTTTDKVTRHAGCTVMVVV